MNWKEKILEGMKLIKQGCFENKNWNDCKFCPFDKYCTYICVKANENNEGDASPELWDLE